MKKYTNILEQCAICVLSLGIMILTAFPAAGISDLTTITISPGATGSQKTAASTPDENVQNFNKEDATVRQKTVINPSNNNTGANQIVVHLTPGISPDKVAAKVGAIVTKYGPLDYATLEFSQAQTLSVRLEELRNISGVLSAEENHRNKISSINVTDPKYNKQWSLTHTGVPDAWEIGATGKGITVAVVDTGVDLNHPDLKPNLVAGYNAITRSSAPGAVQDNNGHGTHVSGTIAAALNGIGIVGVAYEAKIMPIKAMGSDGEGYDDNIADGIVWAADHGAKIINLSIGSLEQSDVLIDAVDYAVKKGCILVSASGNYDPGTGNPGVSYPAADPEVIAVTATDENDKIAPYSATGPEIALAAPGNDIVSDWLNSSYAQADGTSMAAPFVSGEAALIWSIHPDWNRQQVTQALEQGVKDLGAAGRDSSFGYGLAEPALALKLDTPLPTYASPASINQYGGIVTVKDEMTTANLTFPVKAVSEDTSVMLQFAAMPADLPEGVQALSTPLYLDWSGTLQKMLTLELSDASLSQSQVELYRWDGERWLAVGGQSLAGKISLGIFQPGIYVAGTALNSDTAPRLAGYDAVETSIKISQSAYPTGADAVILARNNNFPDALAGAPLAYKLQAPILLTPSKGLTDAVRQEITRLKPKTVYLLGGTLALAPAIQTELNQTYTVRRLAGDTCYGTAAAIAAELGTTGKAVIANGSSYPDALVIASWAAKQGEPILLTSSAALPNETEKALQAQSIIQTTIIGGEAVVSQKIISKFPHPTRLSGLTKYDTEVQVLGAYPPTADRLYIATGENYPDALTGSVLAAQRGSMIVLIPPVKAIPANLTDLLRSWQGKKVTVLGGPGALPDKGYQNILGLLSNSGNNFPTP